MDMSTHAHVQRLTYTLEEASFASGISRSTLYRLIERGELRSVKLGDRRLIPVSELRRLCGVMRQEAVASATNRSAPPDFT
jgi:excisionase family DNA binding protein